MHSRASRQQGFTLVELLVVIGILGVLLAITLIAINPIQQFQNARNAQRQADIGTILDAIYAYEAATGRIPTTATGLSTPGMVLGATTTQTATNTSFSTPNLTYTVPPGNTVTSGTVLVTGCSNSADNGNYTVGSGTTTTVVVNNASGVAGVTGCVVASRLNLCTDLVSTYVAAMPMDPSGSSGTTCTATYNTGYTVSMNAAGNRFTVSAPSAENGATISAIR